jgi:predicted dehydrogenase
MICTPDHWHARIAIEAMRAGKHVFVEKPMVQKPEDGHPLIQVQKETGKVVQVGSQVFRAPVHRKAKELLNQGVVGELNMVESVVSRNTANGAWQYTIPPDASPQTIDWERFQGPAPKRAFDADRFFRWRKYWDYGTGIGGDLYVHRFSALHFMLDTHGPTRVMATGGVRYWNDGRDAPDVMAALYDYPATVAHPAFTLILTCNLADGSGGGPEFRFIGNEGVMEIRGRTITVKQHSASRVTEEQLVKGYNSVRTFSQAQQDAFVEEYRAYHDDRPRYDPNNFGTSIEYTAPQHDSNLEHFTNFFEAIRNDGPIVQDATFGLRAAGPAILVNHSYESGQPIDWDPLSMKVLDSQIAGRGVGE